jgi:hypothetical protein
LLWQCKFGVLVKDERCGDLFEALVGTLRAAKKRNVVAFEGEMLLQGAHATQAASQAPDVRCRLRRALRLTRCGAQERMTTWTWCCSRTATPEPGSLAGRAQAERRHPPRGVRLADSRTCVACW